MTRSFGPAVISTASDTQIDRVTCSYCMFRNHHNGADACTYKDRSNPTPIPDPQNTPDWCEMKAGAVRDATDTINGVLHYVVRWPSKAKSEEGREVYEGIPSEAMRQFRLVTRKAKRGAIELQTSTGRTLASWPDTSAGEIGD